MTLINIGIAGCLGRMGRELVKETINNNQNDFLFSDDILVDKLSYNYPGKESKKIFIDVNLNIKKDQL